jgi:hypothetical protein
MLTLVLAGGFLIAPPVGAEEQADTSYEGLVRLEESVMDEAYVRPDIDLSGFRKVMFDPVTVTYRRPPRRAPARASTGSGNFALSDRQMAELKSIFQTAFEEAMTKEEGWELAEAPGPDVLRINAQLIDLVVSVPTRDMGRSEFFVSEFGEVTLVGELRDSETGQILARGVDRRTIGRSHGGRLFRATSVGARRDVEQLFSAWATFIRGRLDQIRDLTAAAAPAE